MISNHRAIRAIGLAGSAAAAGLVLAMPASANETPFCNAGSGTGSTECGVNALATGNYSTALGDASIANADRSIAAGRLAQATAHDATALGHDAVADLSGRVDDLNFNLNEMQDENNAGVAAAMALGGTMVVPDSTISVSLNAANYCGEQALSGSIVARVAPRVYVSGGYADSTKGKSHGGRVGVAFGL